MIDLPQREVIKKIQESTDLSQEEIQEKIKEKLTQLSGLISEDGAAHIVANELGVQLYKTQGEVTIKELTPNAKQVVTKAKVLQKYEIREFNKNGREGRVANILVGDKTGKVRVVFWNDQVQMFEKINEQDVLRIKNPYVKENNGRTELHLNDQSNIDINPEGITIDVPENNMQQRELKYLKDLNGGEENIEVLGTIVQVYDPRFFPVDPQTNRRVSDEDVAQGKPHEWNYVTTCFLDDGTANVRTTFWKKQTQVLFNKSDEELLSWKDDAAKAQDAKHELLGEIVKIVGRAQKNEQFDRVELTANLVITDVDPAKEIQRIQETTDKESSTQQETTAEQNTPQEEVKPAKEEESQREQTTDSSNTHQEEKKDDQPKIREEAISIDDLEDL